MSKYCFFSYAKPNFFVTIFLSIYFLALYTLQNKTSKAASLELGRRKIRNRVEQGTFKHHDTRHTLQNVKSQH